MGFAVCGGANLQCSFGAAPSVLNVLPVNQCMAAMPVANILDNKPFVNIMPFGTCSSLANPTVASATAAAMGVLTPMPCVPNTLSPWTPGKPQVILKQAPLLDDGSMLMCMWGGVIKINSAGQTNIMV